MTDNTYNFIRKPKNWIIVIIILCVLAALIYNFFASTKSQLPEYTGIQDVTETDVEETVEPQIETIGYINEQLGFSMRVPAEWTKVIRHGYDAYINQVDGAYITFFINDYNPYSNMIAENDIVTDLTALGGVFGSFTKLDNSSYLTVYELEGADYFELTSWDLSTNIRVQMSIPKERYEYYRDIAIYLFDSFQWRKANPIPEGFCMFFSEYGHFEFAVPITWTQAVVDGVYSATSVDTGSIMYAYVTETDSDLSAITQVSFIETVSKGKQNFMLTTFNNTGTVLTAEISYSLNEVTHHCIYTMLAANGYQYEFSFECLDEAYQHDGSLFIGAMNYFRVL